jgi:hypothetical protein
MPLIVVYSLVVALVLAPLHWPYSYYTLVRLTAAIVFAWAATITHKREEAWLSWGFIGLALLFNPIIPIHLTRVVWNVTDVFSAIFLFAVKARISKGVAPDQSK